MGHSKNSGAAAGSSAQGVADRERQQKLDQDPGFYDKYSDADLKGLGFNDAKIAGIRANSTLNATQKALKDQADAQDAATKDALHQAQNLNEIGDQRKRRLQANGRAAMLGPQGQVFDNTQNRKTILGA